MKAASVKEPAPASAGVVPVGELFLEGLEAALEANGMSQVELARLAGFSPASVSRIMNRKRRLAVGHMDAFARALGLDITLSLRGDPVAANPAPAPAPALVVVVQAGAPLWTGKVGGEAVEVVDSFGNTTIRAQDKSGAWFTLEGGTAAYVLGQVVRQLLSGGAVPR